MLGRVQPFVQGHTASAMVDDIENTVRGGRELQTFAGGERLPPRWAGKAG